MRKQQALSILGFDPNSNPSEEDVKKQYRKLALKHHPDKNPGNPDSEEMFKKISSAYEAITKGSDSDSIEDMFKSGFDPFEQFERVFGQFKFNARSSNSSGQYIERQPKPSDRRYRFDNLDVGDVIVTLDQVLFKNPPIELKVEVLCMCRECLGDTDKWYECKNCNGSGASINRLKTIVGYIQNTTPCPVCHGLGWKFEKTCKTCKGKLKHRKIKTVTIPIPTNVVFGNKVRAAGAGNENWNYRNSDIFFTPKMIIPNVSLLSDEDKNTLIDILNKSNK